MAASACAVYRPRVPQATPLYRLVEAHYADVRDEWDERFEIRYGFWRGVTDKAVAAYLDCGILENGFARVRCPACRAEFLVAFSCKGRGLCPSCAAKRAAALAAFLRDIPNCLLVVRTRSNPVAMSQNCPASRSLGGNASP